MAHEVETMFSARTTPWHGLGTVTPDVLTAEEAIKTADLDWTVEKRSIFVGLPGDKRVKIDGRKAIVRSSDSSVLGLVSDRYQEFQNREAFAFADSIVDSGDAKYETAGSLRHGKVIFLTMKLPQEVLVAGEDRHELYIVLRTSHDGTKAIQVAVTPIRVVCMNTMTMALRQAKSKWAMQHTTQLKGKIQEARETLKLSFQYVDQFVQTGTTLAGLKVTDDKFHDIISDLLPNRPRTEEVVDQIMDLYKNSPTNGYYGTAWGGLNALTEYFDHGRQTRSEEAVFSNIMDGSIAGLRNKLTKTLLTV